MLCIYKWSRISLTLDSRAGASLSFLKFRDLRPASDIAEHIWLGKKSSRACRGVALQENTDVFLDQQTKDAIRWFKLTSYPGKPGVCQDEAAAPEGATGQRQRGSGVEPRRSEDSQKVKSKL